MPRLGQVFLKNKHIQKQISDYVLSLNGDCFIEIGPGTGAITKYIYESVYEKLIMIEIDDRLINGLKNQFPLAKLICMDFLVTDLCNLDSSLNNILFGNIPYYITSPIILRFLKENVFKEAVFMVQKEYYEVISAKPKTSQYSSISVLTQSYSSIRKILDVSRNNFYPIPKVDSIVLHLVKDRNHNLDIEEYSMFLRKCFFMPRKTLWNNLRKHFPKDTLEELFRFMNISVNTRSDEMPYEFFVDIFNYLLERTSP